MMVIWIVLGVVLFVLLMHGVDKYFLYLKKRDLEAHQAVLRQMEEEASE